MSLCAWVWRKLLGTSIVQVEGCWANLSCMICRVQSALFFQKRAILFVQGRNCWMHTVEL